MGSSRVRVIIGDGGEIVLPADILAALAVEAGDRLEIEVSAGRLILRPRPRDAIDATYGLASTMWRSVGGSAAFVRETEESWRG